MPVDARRQQLETLSDDELRKIAGGASAPPSVPSNVPTAADQERIVARRKELENLSDEELTAIATGKPPEPTWKDMALQKLTEAGEFIDKYGGAPTRAALSRIVRDVQKHPSMIPKEGPTPATSVAVRAAKAFGEQFGADPSKAPTGKEIATDVGLSTKESIDLPFISSVAGSMSPALGKHLEHVSPAGLAGLVIDIGADPMNVVPVGGVAKLIGKGTAAATKTVATKALKWSAAALEKMPVAGDLARGAKRVGRDLANSAETIFRPKVANDWNELKAIAEKNGIDAMSPPAEWEFGPRNMVTRQEKWLRQSPLSDQYVEAFNAKINEVKDAGLRQVQTMGGGSIPTPEEAGAILRDGYDRAVGQFFDGMENTYNDFIKDYPGLKLAPDARDGLNAKLTGMERWAKGRMARGATNVQRAQAQEILQTVDTAREIVNAGGAGSFKQAVEFMRDVGEAAFKNKNQMVANPPDIEKLRDLYGSFSEALKETIKTDVKNGPKLVEELEASNALLSQFFGDKAVLKDLGNPQLANETLFKRMVANGDSLKLDTLWRVLPAEDFGKLKAALVGDIFEQASKNADGVSFAKIRNDLVNKRVQLDHMLTVAEKKDLADVVKLGDRLGPMILNSSASAEGLGWQNIAKFIKSAVTSDAFVQQLKDRARNKSLLPVVEAAAQEKLPVSLIPQRTIIDTPLKAAQTLSVQRQNQKEGR